LVDVGLFDRFLLIDNASSSMRKYGVIGGFVIQIWNADFRIMFFGRTNTTH
jgi:hypothetical protein